MQRFTEITNSKFQYGFIAVVALQQFAETINSQFQHGLIGIYCFAAETAAVCGNSTFSVSAGIYNDLSFCSDWWK